MQNSVIVDHRLITTISHDEADGLGFASDDVHAEVSNSIIDLSLIPINRLDEAVGITWGSSATFTNCVIRGASKLILLGCGDTATNDPEEIAHVLAEAGKKVVFNHCILEDFVRRGPECQDAMVCELNKCLIRNWDHPKRFCTGGFKGWMKIPFPSEKKFNRSFGAWAHDEGSITATDCVFDNSSSLKTWQKVVAAVGHFGQAINERGLAGFIHVDAYRAGWRRGLTAGPDGHVYASNCWASKGVVVDNCVSHMSLSEKEALVRELESMKSRLGKELCWDWPEPVE